MHFHSEFSTELIPDVQVTNGSLFNQINLLKSELFPVYLKFKVIIAPIENSDGFDS